MRKFKSQSLQFSVLRLRSLISTHYINLTQQLKSFNMRNPVGNLTITFELNFKCNYFCILYTVYVCVSVCGRGIILGFFRSSLDRPSSFSIVLYYSQIISVCPYFGNQAFFQEIIFWHLIIEAKFKILE